MKIDYLWSSDGRVHAINCETEGTNLEAGILCLVSFHEDVVTISNETHRLLVEVPSEFRSSSEKVKVFNATLNILDHEQV
jgi:hypothetical protein